MRRILVTSYYFYPEITPRAFRTFELVKEFSRRGHKVDVVIPDIDYDYSLLERQYAFKVFKVKAGFFLNKNGKRKEKGTKRDNDKLFLWEKIVLFVKSLIKFVYLDGRNFEYAFTLANFLIKNMGNVKYDLVISIGLPLSVHLGTSLYLRKIRQPLAVADYGDPFSFNNEIKNRFHSKYVEKWILEKFDFITIPTEDVVDKYLYFKSRDAIRVVPQGFDFSSVNIADYTKNDIPTFGYAGVFYKNIRNPKILFDYLEKLDMDFRFIIYTDTSNRETMSLIEPYKEKLKNKLVIKDLIPRERCIFELSKMDFLVNQNNLGHGQNPSKLIDYMLAGRPIFNFDQNNFNVREFNEFLEGKKDINYDLQKDLEKYDIKHVVDQLLDLLELRAYNEKK